MKPFDVLSRHISVHKNYLLEASAGTGKTFSIQNIVVRLLIETHFNEDPIPLERILVVTFTKAATRDLKIRIRQNIENTLSHLQNYQNTGVLKESAPDYLKKIIENGAEEIQKACKRLWQALFTFDFAPIYTIHSFCARMLKQFAVEGDVGIHSFLGDEALSQSEVFEVVLDFFRTGIRCTNYSPSQLEILLREDPKQRKLMRYIQGVSSFIQLEPFEKIYEKICHALLELKQKFHIESNHLIEDFKNLSSYFKNHSTAISKIDTLTKVTLFSKLFDQEKWSMEDLDRLIKDGLVFLKALDPLLLKKEIPKDLKIHYPGFTNALKISLEKIVFESRDFSHLLLRFSHDCHRHLKRYQKEEEKLSHDDLLLKMKEALSYPSFIGKVRDLYSAAIIDEFQDTDPLQWDIFRKLFLAKPMWKGYLYLVGDPKQSIYSFRQADIYTYLKAAQALGEEHIYSLGINYRSTPLLVKAINTLFAKENLPSFIPLPKSGHSLSYHPVMPATIQGTLSDIAYPLHFCIADASALGSPKMTEVEEAVFFPFIINEISRLKASYGYVFSQFAVLVRDRHQALRLTAHFDEKGIPYVNQRGTSLVDSLAYLALFDLLYAVMHLGNRDYVRSLLCTPLFGYSLEDVRELKNFDDFVLLVAHLQTILYEKGYAHFFKEVLQSSTFKNEEKVLEQLLKQNGGIEFYRDVQQLSDLIAENEFVEWSTPEGIIDFLLKLRIWDLDEDPRVKKFQDASVDGVKILTLHYSKGLEFDVVFSIGLVSRSGVRDDLISIEKEGEKCLVPSNQDAVEYTRFCEETDAEKMRQLYVALTRAKSMLYLFYPLHLPSKNLSLGEASPMDLLVARLLRPPLSDYEELYVRIKNENGEALFDFLEKKGSQSGISSSFHLSKIVASAVEKEKKEFPLLVPPPLVRISHTPLWITSFSTLSLQRDKSIYGSELAPHDFQSQEKNVHTLPAGSETGLLIHRIFEHIVFSDIEKCKDVADIACFILPFVTGTPYEVWILEVATVVWHTLKAELLPLRNFSLSQLKMGQFYKEMPFAYATNESFRIEEVELKDGLIKGVVDLIFSWEGRYYILDWKTNWLGSGYENYQYEPLKRAMETNHYFLQGEIYKEALKRYLKIMDKRCFDDVFGGVFYLFARGMFIGKTTGIFHWI